MQAVSLQYFIHYILYSAISFMLQSGSLRGACEANNSATITVSYREETSADWISISNYYPSGKPQCNSICYRYHVHLLF